MKNLVLNNKISLSNVNTNNINNLWLSMSNENTVHGTICGFTTVTSVDSLVYISAIQPMDAKLERYTQKEP